MIGLLVQRTNESFTMKENCLAWYHAERKQSSLWHGNLLTKARGLGFQKRIKTKPNKRNISEPGDDLRRVLYVQKPRISKLIKDMQFLPCTNTFICCKTLLVIRLILV